MSKIEARILLDSITDGGSRLTTWIWTYPRSMHAEVMTYRAISRNLASSRAIPAAKLRRGVLESPVIPVHWGKNQPGMQATSEVDDIEAANEWWLRGRDLMAAHHEEGERMGLHKQVINRIIEPWMFAVGVITMTDHANMFHQRRHKDAEPNFQKLANLAWDAYHESMPTYRAPGEWHLPFITAQDHDEVRQAGGAPGDVTTPLKQISTARCARVSYMTHEGKRDLVEDIALFDRLAKTASAGDPPHMSPFEHPAMAVGGRQRIGNLEGWRQFRKFFDNEAGPNTDDRCLACGCWSGRHVTGCSLAT